MTEDLASGRSREALHREVGVRTSSILTELETLAERMAGGRAVTATEVLHAAGRISALRTTIAYTAVLDGGA